MPRPACQIAILLFWMLTMAWFVNDEVWPLIGEGGGGYQTILADRSSDETTDWSILLNGKKAGRARTRVCPETDGACTIHGMLELDDLPSALSGRKAEPSGGPRGSRAQPDLHAESVICVSASGRLRKLDFEIQLPRASAAIALRGVVKGQSLHCRVEGLEAVPGIPQTFEFPLREESVYLERFAPVDRIPNLVQGRSWTTRVVNPLAELPGPLKWLVGGNAVQLVHNRVTTIEEIPFEATPTLCYVVEHRRGGELSKSWVSVQDGTVIRRDFRFAGLKLSLVRRAPPAD